MLFGFAGWNISLPRSDRPDNEVYEQGAQAAKRQESPPAVSDDIFLDTRV
jgi:hypothetical protein